MGKTKAVWGCKSCGHTQSKWAGSCPSCKEWNTLSEEVLVQEDRRYIKGAQKKALRLFEVESSPTLRLPTGMQELDKVLGGGVTKGGLYLVAGEPGIGKSTLMLQLASSLSQKGLNVLYVSGEESVEQTSLRAKRLGLGSSPIYLVSEIRYESILSHVEQINPDILIIDSIQILYKDDLVSSPGSVAQVRELAMSFLHLSKTMSMATFIIGHVTKSGDIAGPKILEHMVDCVVDFSGEGHLGYRMVRANKNRFGPTDELALFQMADDGLKPVLNPSFRLMQERSLGLSGSCIVPVLEGTTPFLVEVQALVSQSAFSTSFRKSSGIDPNRLTLLLAVLEKRLGFALCGTDVFVSVAGGIKISEPALDLGITLSVASSFCNKIIDPGTCVIGEVGLGGEIRSVARLEKRVKEAIDMGFTKAIVPKKGMNVLSKDCPSQFKITGVSSVEEAFHAVIH
jgi:DNA repair protein RadA/Sms